MILRHDTLETPLLHFTQTTDETARSMFPFVAVDEDGEIRFVEDGGEGGVDSFVGDWETGIVSSYEARFRGSMHFRVGITEGTRRGRRGDVLLTAGSLVLGMPNWKNLRKAGIWSAVGNERERARRTGCLRRRSICD